jgi:hypothetical protein
MRVRKALNEARKSGATSVTLLVEDVERKLMQIQQQDALLAKCMSKLSPEDYQEIFGNLLDDKEKSGSDPSP